MALRMSGYRPSGDEVVLAARHASLCQQAIVGRSPGTYRSQFLWRTGRAHLAQEKIIARLCAVGGFDPNGPEARMLRRPKRMRSRTYQRLEEKLYRHDAVLSERFRRK